MRKILFTLLTIAAVFLLILVGALLTLHYWFNPNTLLKPLSQQIELKTGFRLRVDGPLRWHLFPRTGIVIEQLSLTAADPKKSANNLRIDSLSVDLELWPLIAHEKVIVNEIDLDGLNAHLTSPVSQPTTAISPRAIPVVFGAAFQENTHPANQKIRFDVKNIQITNAVIQKTADNSNEKTTFYIDSFALKNFNLDKTDISVPLDLSARIDHQGNLYPISLHTELNINKDTQTIQFKDLEARLNSLELQGNLKASDILTTPQYQGQMFLNDDNLADTLHLLLNKTISMPKTLKSKFDVNGNSKQVTFSNLDLNFDGQRILGIVQYDLNQNHVNAALNAGSLSLPVAKDNLSKTTVIQPTVLNFTTKTLNASGEFSADSQIQVQHLAYNGLALDNINTQLHYDGQTLTFDPLVVTVLQGLYQGKLQWTPSSQQVQVSGALSHLDLARLQAYLGQKPSLSGLLDAKGTLSTHASDTQSLLARLNGQVGLSITQGTWAHLNMTNILGFLNLSNKHVNATGSDTFSSASGNFNIRDGIASNPDLKWISPGLTLKGNGTLDLRVHTLNYHMKLHLDNLVLGQIKGLSKWFKQDIPLTVTGDWNHPSITLDQAALITTTVTDQLDHTVKTVRQFIPIR